MAQLKSSPKNTHLRTAIKLWVFCRVHNVFNSGNEGLRCIMYPMNGATQKKKMFRAKTFLEFYWSNARSYI